MWIRSSARIREHRPSKPGVVGSNPTVSVIQLKNYEFIDGNLPSIEEGVFDFIMLLWI